MTNERIQREKKQFMKFARTMGYLIYEHGTNYTLGHKNHIVSSIEEQALLRLFNTKLARVLIS